MWNSEKLLKMTIICENAISQTLRLFPPLNANRSYLLQLFPSRLFGCQYGIVNCYNFLRCCIYLKCTEELLPTGNYFINLRLLKNGSAHDFKTTLLSSLVNFVTNFDETNCSHIFKQIYTSKQQLGLNIVGLTIKCLSLTPVWCIEKEDYFNWESLSNPSRWN